MNARRIIMGLIVVFALIQLIPVNRTNPAEPDPIVFKNPEAEALAQRACYACHSNTNTWDWYSYIAPVSWIYVDHVNEGRSKLNFSDIAGTIANGGEGGGQGFITRAHAEEEEEGGEGTTAGGEGAGAGSAAEIVDEVAETMQKGEMPPAYYYLMHKDEATLTAAEQQTLIDGVREALAGR